MKKMPYILWVLLMFVPLTATAEILPTFNPTCCARRATDIIVVNTQSAEKGTFQVVDVWKGSISRNNTITVPDLREITKGKMVLFLSRDEEQRQIDKWRPAGYDMRTSVVWISGDEFTSIQQPRRPGPTHVMKLSYMSTVSQLRKHVQMVLDSDRLLQEAKEAKLPKQKVALCSRIIDGHYLNKDEALAILGKCGKPAVSVLREYVNGMPASHERARAIPAFAEAGGRPVLTELTKMLKDELAYWKETAPTLKKGWWSGTGGVAWVRHSRVAHLAVVFRRNPFPPAKSTLVSLRDLFRSTPAVENDQRIGSVSEQLSKAIAAQDENDESSNKAIEGD